MFGGDEGIAERSIPAHAGEPHQINAIQVSRVVDPRSRGGAWSLR